MFTQIYNHKRRRRHYRKINNRQNVSQQQAQWLKIFNYAGLRKKRSLFIKYMLHTLFYMWFKIMIMFMLL